MLKGECNCGQVAFEVDTSVSDVYYCHCSICRRATGTNGIPVIVIANEHFRWIQGEDKISSWEKPGHDWQMSFCSNCGSPLPGSNDETRMYVPCGLIMSGDENLKVAHHIWVDSKAPWDEICGEAKQHREAFEG
ncbi:GFA family protein [Aliikangiella sp. G2MR2-5]|uniref:GFA family protein n=1 Tax=Aliikangiella sp. G2MR2-5 TaxID=2788943 RepID=UPI0018A93728|nr:GFA family protein [Aliikangiella sp. G2MR2-5]